MWNPGNQTYSQSILSDSWPYPLSSQPPSSTAPTTCYQTESNNVVPLNEGEFIRYHYHQHASNIHNNNSIGRGSSAQLSPMKLPPAQYISPQCIYTNSTSVHQLSKISDNNNGQHYQQHQLQQHRMPQDLRFHQYLDHMPDSYPQTTGQPPPFSRGQSSVNSILDMSCESQQQPQRRHFEQPSHLPTELKQQSTSGSSYLDMLPSHHHSIKSSVVKTEIDSSFREQPVTSQLDLIDTANISELCSASFAEDYWAATTACSTTGSVGELPHCRSDRTGGGCASLVRENSVDSTDDWIDQNLPTNPQEAFLGLGLTEICAGFSTPQGSCCGDSFIEVKTELQSPKEAIDGTSSSQREIFDFCDKLESTPPQPTVSTDTVRTRRHSTPSKTSTSYFWQYNAQCKGPKAELVSDIVDDSSDPDDPEAPLDDASYSPASSGILDINTTSSSGQPPRPSLPEGGGKWPHQASSTPQGVLRRRVSSDPYVLTVFEDPVQRRHELIRCAKLRRGDGNDVTPNPVRLDQLGQELKRLNTEMLRQSGLAAQALGSCPSNSGGGPEGAIQGERIRREAVAVVDCAKKEKNKLASKICRLKKKAFHEANKIKYMGLRLEHEELLQAISLIKRCLTGRLGGPLSAPSTSTTSPVSDLEDPTNAAGAVGNGQQLPLSVGGAGMSEPGSGGGGSSGSIFVSAHQTIEQLHNTRVAEQLDLFVQQVVSLVPPTSGGGSTSNSGGPQHPLLASLIRPESGATCLSPTTPPGYRRRSPSDTTNPASGGVTVPQVAKDG